jgi:hypothetical protein
MSIQSGANTTYNNENISIQLRDREEFIEEFLRQKGYQNTSFISTPTISYPRRQRWNYLHDFNKLYKTKIQEKREQQKQLEDEKEMKECTFEPKLNKSVSYINSNNKSYNSLLNLNLIERQDAWIEKRKNNIKQREKEKQKEQMKNCFFTPEINNEDALKKTRIKAKTINLLEDPESYSMYIKRLQKKRDEAEKERKREGSRPGSGNIWEKRLRSNRTNNSYDYTKHEYSRNLSRSKSNHKKKLNNSKYSNNYNILKTESSVVKLSKRIKKGDIDKNTLYEELYKKNICKMDDPYGNDNSNNKNNRNNASNLTGYTEHDSIYNQPIEYGKAIDILHNELYSIDLEPDDENI